MSKGHAELFGPHPFKCNIQTQKFVFVLLSCAWTIGSLFGKFCVHFAVEQAQNLKLSGLRSGGNWPGAMYKRLFLTLSSNKVVLRVQRLGPPTPRVSLWKQFGSSMWNLRSWCWRNLCEISFPGNWRTKIDAKNRQNFAVSLKFMAENVTRISLRGTMGSTKRALCKQRFPSLL